MWWIVHLDQKLQKRTSECETETHAPFCCHPSNIPKFPVYHELLRSRGATALRSGLQFQDLESVAFHRDQWQPQRRPQRCPERSDGVDRICIDVLFPKVGEWKGLCCAPLQQVMIDGIIKPALHFHQKGIFWIFGLCFRWFVHFHWGRTFSNDGCSLWLGSLVALLSVWVHDEEATLFRRRHRALTSGFSMNGGTQNGWCVSWKIPAKNDDLGYPHGLESATLASVFWSPTGWESQTSIFSIGWWSLQWHCAPTLAVKGL